MNRKYCSSGFELVFKTSEWGEVNEVGQNPCHGLPGLRRDLIEDMEAEAITASLKKAEVVNDPVLVKDWDGIGIGSLGGIIKTVAQDLHRRKCSSIYAMLYLLQIGILIMY